MEETIGQFGQWREKAFEGCLGLCKDPNHLRFNTIHTHRWFPKPPSSLFFMSKSHMGDQEFSDPASVRHNEDWASPDGQAELRREGLTWYQRQWCQGCCQTREVKRRAGEGLQVEEKEDDPVTLEESLEAMQVFYNKMAMVENSEEQNHEEAIAEQDSAVKCPEARTKVESSKPGAHKRKRRGGKGSRLRRLLLHQLLLTERRGLPLSRLLRTEAKSQRQGRREQEESASPQLRRRPESAGEEGKGKNGEGEGVRETRGEVEDRREEMRCCSRGALSGEINLSTPRSTKTEATTPSPQVFPQTPGTPPFPHLTPPPTPSTLPVSPPYTLPFTPPYTLPFTPPSTPPYTPLFTPMYTSLPAHHTPPFTPPPCGPMPGLQWLFCGGCQAWGTVTPNT